MAYGTCTVLDTRDIDSTHYGVMWLRRIIKNNVQREKECDKFASIQVQSVIMLFIHNSSTNTFPTSQCLTGTYSAPLGFLCFLTLTILLLGLTFLSLVATYLGPLTVLAHIGLLWPTNLPSGLNTSTSG